MKQPKIKNSSSPSWKEKILRSQNYRDFAFVSAIIGTLLISFAADLPAFIGVILMFIGSASAIFAVILSLRTKQTGDVISGLLILAWNVLFPLIMTARQIPVA